MRVKRSESRPIRLVRSVGCHQFLNVVYIHAIGGERLPNTAVEGLP